MDAKDVAALIGVAAIVAGLLMVSVPAALIGAGLLLVLGARNAARKKPADG